MTKLYLIARSIEYWTGELTLLSVVVTQEVSVRPHYKCLLAVKVKVTRSAGLPIRLIGLTATGFANLGRGELRDDCCRSYPWGDRLAGTVGTIS